MLIVGLVLALMILPIVTAVSRSVFTQTPRRLQEGALALGATRWEMIRMTVLPFGKSAMISASMLGLGRALGETMAVAIILSVSGGVTFNLISSANPSTIAANIALDFPESSGHRRQRADRLRPRAVRRDADHQHGRPGDHQPRGEDLMSVGDERQDPPVTQPEEKPPPTPPKVGRHGAAGGGRVRRRRGRRARRPEGAPSVPAPVDRHGHPAAQRALAGARSASRWSSR